MAENVDNISSANLDTQLLNRTQQEESAEKSGSLREAKKVAVLLIQEKIT